MIPTYLAYRQYQRARRESEMEAERNGESSYLNSLISDRETFALQGVSARRYADGDRTDDCFVNGKLSLVERPNGVMLEWCPVDEDGWVVTNGDDADTSLSRSLESRDSRRDSLCSKFSVYIKSLRAFQHEEPKKGCPWIRLIGTDGTSFIPLYFRQGGMPSFIEHLQRYAVLKRSAREANMVMFSDERIDALEQSFSMLDLSGDFLSRLVTQPYATAMTGLGKVADFVQDQMFSSLLESDTESAEEQIKAYRELREQEEEAAGKLRLHNDAGFELVTQLELPPRAEFHREKPLTKEVWRRHKNADGSFKDVRSLRVLIFRGGLTPSLRFEAWKYLLGAYDWNQSTASCIELRRQQEADYKRMKEQWKTMNADQESRFSSYAARKAQIGKDVIRTDRAHAFFGGDDNEHLDMMSDILMTYCMYNFDLGYVQGMSDYLSPLLVVMQNEVDTFWAFVALMQRVQGNFEMDQVDIKRQLRDLRDLLMFVNPKLANYLESNQSDDMYFCFRWVLVCFKREFSFDHIMKLWEVLWTDLPCTNFHLLMCVAILDKEMKCIIENKFGLTEILKHVNDLSMNIDLDETLTSAEAIYHQLAASQDQLPKYVCDILSLPGHSSAPIEQ